ncbi:MAG: hypothetical protein HC930_03045 [Hydrococcus sp. SU_1_0]|nr:hypothetical protein [Hydrococcus sp. SU_1_0]
MLGDRSLVEPTFSRCSPQKLGSPLSVVLGDYNYISNSFVLQLNGDSEKISEQFKNLPPETLQKLVEAIAMWMRQNKTPS